MVTTHTGMNITAAEYMHVVDDILGVLNHRQIDDISKNEVLAILWSLKGMIIGK
jgi:hemoglobin